MAGQPAAALRTGLAGRLDCTSEIAAPDPVSTGQRANGGSRLRQLDTARVVAGAGPRGDHEIVDRLASGIENNDARELRAHGEIRVNRSSYGGSRVRQKAKGRIERCSEEAPPAKRAR